MSTFASERATRSISALSSAMTGLSPTRKLGRLPRIAVRISGMVGDGCGGIISLKPGEPRGCASGYGFPSAGSPLSARTPPAPEFPYYSAAYWNWPCRTEPWRSLSYQLPGRAATRVGSLKTKVCLSDPYDG